MAGEFPDLGKTVEDHLRQLENIDRAILHRFDVKETQLPPSMRGKEWYTWQPNPAYREKYLETSEVFVAEGKNDRFGPEQIISGVMRLSAARPENKPSKVVTPDRIERQIARIMLLDRASLPFLTDRRPMPVLAGVSLGKLRVGRPSIVDDKGNAVDAAIRFKAKSLLTQNGNLDIGSFRSSVLTSRSLTLGRSAIEERWKQARNAEFSRSTEELYLSVLKESAILTRLGVTIDLEPVSQMKQMMQPHGKRR